MMLAEYKRVKSKIQGPLLTLMIPHVAKVDEAMQPGMTTLTWTSLNIEKYLQNVLDKLGKSNMKNTGNAFSIEP